MNRKLQLKYCSVCLNRKFDPNQGIICKITDKAADFLDTCADYQVDENKLKEEKEAELVEMSTQELLTSLPQEIKNHLRQHQSFGFAVLGGMLAAIFSAILWAVISVAFQYQIGWMAIGIGLLVGFSVRFFGAGIDKKFGYLGAGIAVFACLLGNLLTQVGFHADQESIPYLEVLGYLTPLLSLEIIMDSFVPMDLFFFGLAGFEGYKFAFRTLPSTLENEKDYAPQFAKLRFPMAAVSAVLIAVCLFMVSSHSEAERTNFYDSGKVFSKGKLLHGLAEGEWEYFYEDGSVGAKGNYSNGLEEGFWQYYDESGMLSSLQQYHKGFLHGTFTTYYNENLISQQGEYKNGRMDGEWTTFYEDKSIQNKGNYFLDMPNGEWEYFHENGKLYQKGNYERGEKSGVWKTWGIDGQITEEINHISENEVEWITYRNPTGKPSVQNGNGDFVSFHPNGKTAISGTIKNKKMEGDWKFFDENGKHTSTIQYKDNIGKVLTITDKDGSALVKNGAGRFIGYFESGNLQDEGEYTDGLKQGKWTSYFDGDDNPVQEIANYKDGLLVGRYVTYYPNGKEQMVGGYENGIRDGLWTWFTMDGDIDSEVRFAEGKKTGNQIFYNEFKTIVKKERYEDGDLVETIIP
ncbi:hypothetical protein ACFSKL_15920 [Belliella marina]|uniref:Antitoxin component YwqK of the YwqJK toxin-antitoxin module n=1 Tax=Belliella marina TaxID=1644146 RepID=A0ABW4VQ86_9BACT